jgi:hypothetical protein
MVTFLMGGLAVPAGAVFSKQHRVVYLFHTPDRRRVSPVRNSLTP